MFPVFSDVLIKRVIQQVHGHHDVAIIRRKVKSTWMAYKLNEHFIAFLQQVKLEDLKVLRRSPDLLNNVKIGQINYSL